MKFIGTAIQALVLAMSMASASLAQDLDPTGVWVAEKNSDYAVSLCGPDNSAICFELVALRGKMDRERNRVYMNKLIIDSAKASGANAWKGKMTISGQTGDATIRMLGQNDLRVKVCAMIVMCEEYAMTRVN